MINVPKLSCDVLNSILVSFKGEVSIASFYIPSRLVWIGLTISSVLLRLIRLFILNKIPIISAVSEAFARRPFAASHAPYTWCDISKSPVWIVIKLSANIGSNSALCRLIFQWYGLKIKVTATEKEISIITYWPHFLSSPDFRLNPSK